MNALISVLTFLVVITVLITVHEWGHYRMATLVGVRVIRFSLGFGKPLYTWTPLRQPILDGRPQTTEFVIACLPFGGYVKMQDELEVDQKEIPIDQAHQSFNRKPLWARAAVVFAGPFANFVLAVSLFVVLNWIGTELPKARLVNVVNDGAAAAARLQPGDLVVRVDHQKITDSFQLREMIRQSNQGLQQKWLVERDGEELLLTVTPRLETQTDEFLGREQIGRVGAVIGSAKELVIVRYGFWEGITRGIEKAWSLSALTVKTVGQIIIGQASVKNITGPLTVAEYSGKTAALGWETFLLFLGLMSVSLGVLNLLPLPMLDGGHLMYYLWELLTGKSVSEVWLDRFQRTGFVLLVLLTFLAFYNDLVRVFGLPSYFS